MGHVFLFRRQFFVLSVLCFSSISWAENTLSHGAEKVPAPTEAMAPPKAFPEICPAGSSVDACYEEVKKISEKLEAKAPELFARLKNACVLQKRAKTPGDVEDAKVALVRGGFLTYGETNFFAAIGTAYGEARSMREGKVDPGFKGSALSNPVVRANMLMSLKTGMARRDQMIVGGKKSKVPLREPTLARVLLQAKQYSCWNGKDPNAPCVLTIGSREDKAEVIAIKNALQAYLDLKNSRYKLDPASLENSTHYYSSSMSAPKWARRQTALEPAFVTFPPPPPPDGYTVNVSETKPYRHLFFRNVAWKFKDSFKNK